ncbi:hypothetical protein [Spirillospora sp. NPDC048823]|uniref:hypothetical protein n=1 Tax=unclassified Spirillospora TaxID=2642701 RepID=UPI00370FBCE1
MDLYAAFADVPRPAELHGCPCCVAADEGRPLLAAPLRDLTAEDLARYAAKALNTWGGPQEFRYFTPRLLELAADDQRLRGGFQWQVAAAPGGRQLLHRHVERLAEADDRAEPG